MVVLSPWGFGKGIQKNFERECFGETTMKLRNKFVESVVKAGDFMG